MDVKSKMKELAQIKEKLSYDPITGIFVWASSVPNKYAGKEAGQKTNDGYLRINVNGKKMLAHRLAWWYIYGELPEGIVDHIDRNKLNNSAANLRVVSSAENAQNRGTALGFSWHEQSKAFATRIIVKGKTIGLGYHKTMLEARAAYLQAVKTYHPFKT